MAARGSAKAGPPEPQLTEIAYLEHLGYATDNLGAVLRSAGLLESMLPTLEALGLDPGLRLEEHHDGEQPLSLYVPANFTIPLEEGRTVDMSAGNLRYYRRCWERDKCNLDRSGPVVFTRKQSLAKIQRIADAQGEDLRFTEDDMRHVFPPVGYWVLHSRRYRGVKTDQCVGGTICGHTGEVLWYTNAPPIDPPETMEIRITPQQAVNLALAKGFRGMLTWLGLKTNRAPSLFIVDTSTYKAPGSWPNKDALPPRYRQCWDVALGQGNFSRRLERWAYGEENQDIEGRTVRGFYVDAYSGVVYDWMAGGICE